MSALLLLLLLLTMATVSSAGKYPFATQLVPVIGIEESNKCLIYSPVGIQLSLAFLYLAAGGNTKAQLRNVFEFSSSKEVVAANYGKMLASMNKIAALTVGTTFFIKSYVPVSKKFENLVYKFKSELETLAPSETVARRQVNDWIDQQTAHNIPKLIPDSIKWEVDGVLVTNVHFKAKWSNSFSKTRTHLASNGEIGHKFEMMVQDSVMQFGVLKQFNAYGALLKLQGTDISMLVLRPKQDGGLAALENKLKNVDLKQLPKTLHDTKVTLMFPKFKIETDIGLMPTLQKLQMENVCNNAVFSGMLSTNGSFSFTEIRHKTVIAVDEEGIEIASITGIQVCDPEGSDDNKFNHNFFFALIDKDNVYFSGHVPSS